jgi:nitrite reductase (cytochrome c-552)
MREGATKVTDHHVQSPLLNVARACLQCHHFTEREMLERVNTIQDRNMKLLSRAEDALVSLISRVVEVKKQGVSEELLVPVYALQRKAQWRADFVNAENSMGFHAPQEAARILGEAIDYARQGELLAQALFIKTSSNQNNVKVEK